MFGEERTLRGLTTTALAVLVAAGCAPAAAPVPAAPAAPGAAPAPAQPALAPEAPKRGGVITYAPNNWADTLHPLKLGDVGERRVAGPIYETILVLKRPTPDSDFRINFDVDSWLAERWEQPNPTTVLLHVRKGIKWQDGTEFTAGDIVWTLQQVMDPQNAYPIRSRFKSGTSVTAEDKYTVKITLPQVQTDILANLADTNLMILPKHLGEQGTDFTKTAVGTGPLKIVSFDRAKAGVYARNESYWRQDQPYVDGMETYFGLDAASRNAAFLTKKIDLTAPADKVRRDEVTSRLPETKVATMHTDYGNSLVLKLDRPPYDDVRVRRAIHLALDRPGLIKVATFGEGIANPPGMPGHKAGWAIPPEELNKLPGFRPSKDQDIAEAKRLLAEAGYPDGFKTSVVYSRQRQSSPVIIEPVAGQLRNIGVDVTLDGRPNPEYRKAALEGSYEMLVDFTADMSFKRQAEFLHSKGPLNKMGLRDEQVDRLLDIQDTVLDVAERRKAALELQRLLLDKMYVVPTIEMPAYQVWQPWVKNYFYNIGISELLESTSLAQVWLVQEQMPSDRRKG